jgi:hypothetical protein
MSLCTGSWDSQVSEHNLSSQFYSADHTYSFESGHNQLPLKSNETIFSRNACTNVLHRTGDGGDIELGLKSICLLAGTLWTDEVFPNAVVALPQHLLLRSQQPEPLRVSISQRDSRGIATARYHRLLTCNWTLSGIASHALAMLSPLGTRTGRLVARHARMISSPRVVHLLTWIASWSPCRTVGIVW